MNKNQNIGMRDFTVHVHTCTDKHTPIFKAPTKDCILTAKNPPLFDK